MPARTSASRSFAATVSARAPRVVPVAAWLVLAGLLTFEAFYEVLGGRGALTTLWLHDVVIGAAAALCLVRGLAEPREQTGPALWLGAGLASWWAGDVIWNSLWGTDPDPPYPTIADAFWLAWYPLTGMGLLLLIRDHVRDFELHRWMDGVAVMLIVLTPFAALFLEPAFTEAHGSAAARAVNLSYPVLDSLMIGAVVGVYGLLAWHPTGAWVLLGVGCVSMALADGLFAVHESRPSVIDDSYDFMWSGGALLIAYAVWLSWDAREKVPADAYGWRVIFLPLLAQALAAAIQIYGLFDDLGPVERAVTFIVLLVAIVQIIVSRPRAPTDHG